MPPPGASSILLAASLALLAGCATEPTDQEPVASTRHALTLREIAPTSAECGCTGGTPCALPCEAAGDCETLTAALPLERPLWCELYPWHLKTRNDLKLLAGCGYVGVRELFASRYSGEFRVEERWFDAATGRLAGRALRTHDAGLTCEGVLPPADCELVTCNACSWTSREKLRCEIEDVGLAWPAGLPRRTAGEEP